MSHDSAVSAPHPQVRALDGVASDRWPLHTRVAALFVRPSRLFEELRVRPEWMGPLLLSILVGIVVIVLLPDQVLYDGMQGATARRGKEIAEITSDPATVALWERLRLSMGVLFTQPVKAWLIAGALFLASSAALRGGATFWSYLAVTTHAMLISALGALMVVPLQLGRSDAVIDPALALVLPGLAELGLIGRALAAVNPFTVWMLLVLATGVAVLNRRSRGLPAALLVGLYAASLVGISALVG